jgi:hypothetical protein
MFSFSRATILIHTSTMSHNNDCFDPTFTVSSGHVSDLPTVDTRVPSMHSAQFQSKQRKKKAPTLRDSDWEPHKLRIFELHASGAHLEEVRETLRVEKDFLPEYVTSDEMVMLHNANQVTRVRQYTWRYKKWGLIKNVKQTEMSAVVRKSQKRKLTEVDKRELVFWVRGQRVARDKIQRWMQDHGVSEATLPQRAACG